MNAQESAERLLETYGKLSDAFDRLDPNDPDYAEKVKALGNLYKAGVDDYSSHAEAEAALIKIQNETEVAYDKNTIEDNRNKEMERANKKQEKLAVWRIGIGALTGVGQIAATIWTFCRSTKKEVDEAYLTQTSKTTVTEVLRKGIFGRFLNRNNEF